MEGRRDHGLALPGGGLPLARCSHRLRSASRPLEAHSPSPGTGMRPVCRRSRVSLRCAVPSRPEAGSANEAGEFKPRRAVECLASTDRSRTGPTEGRAGTVSGPPSPLPRCGSIGAGLGDRSCGRTGPRASRFKARQAPILKQTSGSAARDKGHGREAGPSPWRSGAGSACGTREDEPSCRGGSANSRASRDARDRAQ